MSDELVWRLTRAITDTGGNEAPLLARVVEMAVERPGTTLSTSLLLNLLEDAESVLPLDDAVELLRQVKLIDVDLRLSPAFELADSRFEVAAIAAAVESTSAIPLDTWSLASLLQRSRHWAEELALVVDAESLAGVPTFWHCQPQGRGEARHEPLDLAVGSMSTSDLLALWCEAAGPMGTPTSAILALVKRLLALQEAAGTPFSGALYLRQFDDDFIHNYDRNRGAFPTLDATANACSAWAQFLRAVELPDDIRGIVVDAVQLGLSFVLDSQRDDGSWALHRDRVTGLPPGPLSIRFAVLAITDALATGALTNDLVHRADAALDAITRYLTRATRPDGVSWATTFRSGGLDRALETTALLLLPLTRLAPRIKQTTVVGATRYVRRELAKSGNRALEVQFRVPTWTGISSDFQMWELPFDAVAASAVLTLPEPDHADIEFARGAMTRIVGAEQHGHWYDLGGEALGQQRAFPSNSLLNVRAIRDWNAASRAALFSAVPSHRVGGPG